MSHVHAATCGMCHTADCCFLKFNSAAGLLVCSHRIASVWDCLQRSSAVIIIGICHFCEDGDPPTSYLWFIHIYLPRPIFMIQPYQPTKLHIYDPCIPSNKYPCLWSMNSYSSKSMSTIYAYLPIKTNIYDPAIPINRAQYRWLMHTCQPAPYLYMIHAY